MRVLFRGRFTYRLSNFERYQKYALLHIRQSFLQHMNHYTHKQPNALHWAGFIQTRWGWCSLHCTQDCIHSTLFIRFITTLKARRVERLYFRGRHISKLGISRRIKAAFEISRQEDSIKLTRNILI